MSKISAQQANICIFLSGPRKMSFLFRNGDGVYTFSVHRSLYCVRFWRKKREIATCKGNILLMQCMDGNGVYTFSMHGSRYYVNKILILKTKICNFFWGQRNISFSCSNGNRVGTFIIHRSRYCVSTVFDHFLSQMFTAGKARN